MSSTTDFQQHHHQDEPDRAQSFTNEEFVEGSIEVDGVEHNDEALPHNNVEVGNAVLALEAPLPVGLQRHIITVNTGEDITEKIISFCSLASHRMISILSGNGYLSFVELHNQSSNEVMSYEGNFRVLSLSGLFQQSGNGGQLDESRKLKVSFARNDHQVFGGVVAGRLLAASQVHVVLGSFVIQKTKRSNSNRTELSSAPSESSSAPRHSAQEQN